MKRYIKDEVKVVLEKLYPTETPIEDIAKQVNLSVNTLKCYASSLGLSRPKLDSWNKLPKHEEQAIIKNYQYGDLDALAKTLGKTKHAITEWARRRGIKRMVVGNRKGDLTPLLDESLQSFYWLGLLASDGYVSKDGHVMFSQGEKDRDIVSKFADYVDSSVYEYITESGYSGNKRTIYRVNVKDKDIGPTIRKMWGMSDDDVKTYSGISSDFIESEDQAKAFLIGFFDGDGHLTRYKGGNLEVHGNWMTFLNNLFAKLNCSSLAKVNKRGYAHAYISVNLMKELKQFIDQHSLVHNERKWNL